MSVPPDQISSEREALGSFGSNGNPTFDWMLTSENLTGLVRLVVQDRILPVIFVPGIMGSNLMDLNGEPVWRLDTTMGVPWSLATNVAPMGAGGRQRLMHPGRTQVDPNGKVPSAAGGTVFGAKKRDRQEVYRNQRFWGEIADSSYHKFLLWLEDRLNGQGLNPALWPDFSYRHPMMSAAPVPGQPRPEPRLMEGQEMVVRGMAAGTNEKPQDPLMSDDLLKRVKMRMPVYACGYNWLDSNSNSARLLKERIEHVIGVESQRASCEQVLLVTHSMGGLVARRCAALPGMEAAIAGVVHGVMPAVGASVAYRRCKVGMRDESFVAGLVIGSNGREVTAVFSQAPGALQLLPSAQYNRHWLKVLDDQGGQVEAVPQSDPYSEIYLRRDRWWGLVREEWLRPDGGRPISWGAYEENINEARDFHDAIRGAYHINTYVYYGADEGIPSFETVRWRMKQGARPDSSAPPTPERVRDMGFEDVRDGGASPLYVGGQLEVVPSYGMGMPATYQSSYWELVAERHDAGGDGTVPASSGQSPMLHANYQDRVRQQYRLTGFEHEPSYNDEGARLVTLHCIQKIAAEARVS